MNTNIQGFEECLRDEPLGGFFEFDDEYNILGFIEYESEYEEYESFLDRFCPALENQIAAIVACAELECETLCEESIDFLR